MDDLHFYELHSETGEAVRIRKSVHFNVSSGEAIYTINGHRCCVPCLPYATKAEVETLIKEYNKMKLCNGVWQTRYRSIEMSKKGQQENGVWRAVG